MSLPTQEPESKDPPVDVWVSSNWIPANEGDLRKTIFFSLAERAEFDFRNITPESCVCLCAEENAKTKPVLQIKSDHLLTGIDILSEGSFIEVFGENNEYLGSCTSEFVDDWEDFAVFHSKISLPNVDRCELKFLRIKDEKRLWLYNIQLSVLKNKATANMMFNLTKVDEMVNRCEIKLPKNALNFKSLFESYFNSTAAGKLEQTCGDDVFPSSHNKFQLLSKPLMKNPNFYTQIIKQDLNKKKYVTDDSKDKIAELVKNYVDVQLVKVKDDIWTLLDSKLNEFHRENQTKLDQIIQLLTSKENQS